jgi:organic hydroperoxide reductase OsmC/OhrA
MAGKDHRYKLTVSWTGNRGTGTSRYDAYGREHTLSAAGKPDIQGSSDPAFRGDPGRWNPEELFVGSISACHKLWYLHLCAVAGVVVVDYVDHAEALMREDTEGAGRFVSATLKPQVVLAAGSDVALAERLHADAHAKCFVANSLNFPVQVEAETTALK